MSAKVGPCVCADCGALVWWWAGSVWYERYEVKPGVTGWRRHQNCLPVYPTAKAIATLDPERRPAA